MNSSSPKIGSAFALAAAIYLTLIPIRIARAEIPSGPNVATVKQLWAKVDAFDAKTIIEGYKAAKRDNPKWDAEAIRFLENFVKIRKFSADAPGIADAERQGRLLHLDGCDDPMVLYAYGRILVGKGWNTQAEWFMRRAAETMPSHGYAPTWRAAAASHACRIMRGHRDADGARPYAEMVLASLPEMLKSPAYGKDDRASLVAQLQTISSVLSAAERKTAWESVKDLPNADPVAVLLLEGEYHIAAAWQARGGNWAGAVTQDGWKGFESHLADAKTALTKAWETDKTIPEPATAMIPVAMGTGGIDEMRLWFDRAVRARFDDPEPYDSFIYGLYPRWHGDRQALLDFGLECLNTGRFDTDVPIHFLDVLLAVRDECDDGDMTGWARPEVYDRVKELLDKTLGPKGAMPDDPHYRSLEAAFCVQAGHCDDARKVVELLNGKVLASGTSHVHVTPAEVVGAAYAYGSGDASASAIQAGGLAAAGKGKEAIEAYETAIKEQKNPAGIQFLRGALQVACWESDFRDGKEVPLTVDSDMSGFHPAVGRWHPDGSGGLLGTADAQQHLDVICEGNFGERWELKANIDFVKKAADWDAGGLTLATPGSVKYFGYAIDFKNTFAARGSYHEEESSVAAKVKERDNEVIFKRDGLEMTVKVNGEEVYRGHVPNDTDARRLRIGLGGWPLADNDVVGFRNLRITKIGK